jgi:CHAT domain-containing protein
MIAANSENDPTLPQGSVSDVPTPRESAAELGQRAELCLRAPREPRSVVQALQLVSQARALLGPVPGPLTPKLDHLVAMATRWAGGDLAKAAALDRGAYNISLEQAPEEAILFAAEWGDWGWDNALWAEAAEGYDSAHRALRRFVLRYVLDDAERLDVVANTKYATRGAFALGLTGRLQDGILLLERACDLVFGGNADQRALQRLATVNPDLNARVLGAIASKANSLKLASENFGLDAYGNLTAAAQQAQEALDAAVIDVRAIDGFADFALPSGWSDVQAALFYTPLVYLIATDKGAVAWIVNQMPDGQLRVAVAPLAANIEAIRKAAMPFINAEFGQPRADARAALDSLLDWLGVAIMVPVRDALATLGYESGQIGLRPFGMLNYLPLHAARSPGPAGTTAFPSGDITYIYSARAFAQARRQDGAMPLGKSLIIDNPRPLPVEFDPLKLADFEAAVVGARHAGDVLTGSKANTERVMAALPEAALIHFICHGTVARDLGYSGILLLANQEIFTYRHLRRLPELRARLAVLSACSSGAAGVMVEHPLSLPAAFLAAGVRAVIGTLWHADELASLLLVTRFYDLWSSKATPAAALGQACDWLRTSTAETLRDQTTAVVLASPAGAALRDAPAAAIPYAHPWYTAAFFVAGA